MLLNKQQQETIHHIVEEEKAYKYFSKWDYTGNMLEGIRKDIDNLKDVLKEQGVELIQCERSKFQNLNDELVCKVAQIQDLKSKNLYLEDQWLISKTKLCKIEQMGFWKRLVYLFKGVKI